MFHLVGVNELVQTNLILSHKFLKQSPKNLDELELGFHNFLKDYQPEVARLDHASTQIIDDSEMELKLANLFRTDTVLNDRNQSKIIEGQYGLDDRIKKEKALKQALVVLEKKIPEVFKIFNLTIDSLFMRNSKTSGGGSTSNAIGVIWINCRSHWSEQDLVELLVHEFTHNLVFIDELRFLHFTNYKLVALEENFSKSAILNIKRPIDKVFHSIVVATEVLLLRRNYLGEPVDPKVHPPSNIMLFQARDALDSLRGLPNYDSLLTERGKLIMQKCDEHLKEIESNVMEWKPTA